MQAFEEHFHERLSPELEVLSHAGRVPLSGWQGSHSIDSNPDDQDHAGSTPHFGVGNAKLKAEIRGWSPGHGKVVCQQKAARQRNDHCRFHSLHDVPPG
jgi:hypothetical protein